MHWCSQESLPGETNKSIARILVFARQTHLAYSTMGSKRDYGQMMEKPESPKKAELRFDRNPGVLDTPSTQLEKEAADIFAKLDSKRDGEISNSELIKGLKIKDSSTRQLEWIAAIYSLRNEIKALDSTNGTDQNSISSKDFALLTDSLMTFDSKYGSLPLEFSSTMKLAASADSYQSNRLWGYSSIIDPAATKQSRLGTCYLTATLRALAVTNPDLIRTSISEQTNGNFKVTFAGNSDKALVVPAPSRTELAIINEGGHYGSWPAVLISAYGQYRQENLFRRFAYRLEKGEFDAQAAEAGSAVDALRILTGSPAEELKLNNHAEDKVRKKLSDLFADGQKVPVLASSIQQDADSSRKTNDGLLKGHVFTITGFDPNTEGGGTITFSDPNFNASMKQEMSLDSAYKNFRSFSYLLPENEPSCTLNSPEKLAYLGTAAIVSMLPAYKLGSFLGNLAFRVGLGSIGSITSRVASTFATGMGIPISFAFALNSAETACLENKLK